MGAADNYCNALATSLSNPGAESCVIVLSSNNYLVDGLASAKAVSHKEAVAVGV